ncbi:hypothetical protein [Hymenobacter psychrophilus]|nr:hypothetical protein [Hymenobacter psychrophilus]
MAKNKKNARGASWSFSEWLGVAITVLTFGYMLRTCAHGQRMTQALEGPTATVKAVVIDKKNFFGNSPVSNQFAYSYRFKAKGQQWEGNSRDPALHVGDSMLVDYALDAPEYNRPHESE